MYRFVGVVVILIPQEVLGCLLKEVFQIVQHLLFATHECYHTVDVMGYKPSLLVGVRFDGAVPFRQSAVGGLLFPGTGFAFGAEPHLVFRVEDVLVVQ